MITSAQIADRLGIFRPTPEQADVIENAPVDAPSSVIAGAGSGKTELMSSRVLWLVSNQHLKPAEVLGLTFTRKAARELQSRVNQRLLALRETDLWPSDVPYDYDQPKIATYNSFANEVFRSVSLAIGYEADVPLLGEAGSYLLAKKFLDTQAFGIVPSIADRDRRAESLIDLLLALEAEMGEHRVTAEHLSRYLDGMFDFAGTLPKEDGGTDTAQLGYMIEYLSPLIESKDLARLAEAYRDFKRREAVVDFSDQLRLAADAVEADPALSLGYSQQFKQVLLDEYQDTSSVQVRLLSGLFRSRAVLAVGDPNQSIYGWRGAAAGTMESFGDRFGARERSVFPLSSNWRSDKKILELANISAASLAAQNQNLTAAPLVLTARPDSGEGEVQVQVFEHEHQEAQAVAGYFAARMSPTSTAAILFRKRKHMARYASALDEAGVRYEITGLGGLLQIAEVADLVAALRVIADPEAGAALMRLLVGPRWRVAPAHIAQLHAYAKRLGRMRHESDSAIPLTLIEALDELAQADPFGKPDFDVQTLQRLRDAARLFRVLRQQVNLNLAEFVRAVAAELWMDIELMASNRPEPLANLYAFYDLIAEFEAGAREANLTSFLNWLGHAERKQRLEPPRSGAKAGVVQLLTVHSSKGLEWDLVSIPDLVEGEFPSEESSYRGWMSAGKLPYDLRADAQALPRFTWPDSSSQKDFKDRFNGFREAVKLHLYGEQGRLAYVAFTRAKHSLMLSAAHWAAGSKKPRPLSRYLELALQLVGTPDIGTLETTHAENPFEQDPAGANWPASFGVERSADLDIASNALFQQLDAADLLEVSVVASEMMQRRSPKEFEFPTRMSATALSAFILQPEEFVKRIVRPLPAEYQATAELGTMFHSAVESALSATESDSGDYLAEFAEMGEAAAELVRNFGASAYRDAKPWQVEYPIQFSLGELSVICKLDAVFEDAAGLHIVDWKTGAVDSKTQSGVDAKMKLQLSIYRVALHRATGRPLAEISAALFFARSGQVVSPDQLLDESEIQLKFEEAKKALRYPDSSR